MKANALAMQVDESWSIPMKAIATIALQMEANALHCTPLQAIAKRYPPIHFNTANALAKQNGGAVRLVWFSGPNSKKCALI